jgi:predicted transcriptional regulator of viral defense system
MTRVALDRAITALAESQWGLLTAAQARAVGVSRVQLTRLVQDEVLTRLAHGVYVLRGAAGVEYLELRAAWLGLDPERMAADRLRDPSHGVVVTHASAARLHQLGDLEADRHEFTLPARKQTRRPDVRLHRGVLAPAEVVTIAGLPVATPERVIVDLLDDRHDGEHVARVLASAVRSRSIDLEQLTPRLSTFAVRFGFAAGEGGRVLDHLLELGGAADQVVADSLVTISRTHNLDLAEAARAALGAQLSSVLPAMGEAAWPGLSALVPDMGEAARAALSALVVPHMDEAAQAVLGASNTATRLAEGRRAHKAIEGADA